MRDVRKIFAFRKEALLKRFAGSEGSAKSG
jgi:hypothetical protein